MTEPDDSAAEGDGRRAGSHDLGEEARKLLGAVQEWAQRALPAPPSGHAGPECQWCPVCQLASVMRGEHPEITERVAEAGTAVFSALRALAEAAARANPTSAQPPEPGASRVQHIHLDDTDAPG